MSLFTETDFSTDEKPKWFPIRTYALKEKIAEINFIRQGFNVYLPQTYSISRHARRTILKRNAFFPGYLFLHLIPSKCSWITIASTLGARGPIKFGNYIPPVPDEVIDSLLRREDENGIISIKRKTIDNSKVGDKVNVSFPNNMKYAGIFQMRRGKDRAMILLDIMSKQVPTVVPISNVTSC